MRRVLRFGVVVLAMLGLGFGCSSKKGTSGEEDGPKGTFIDEPIILAWSGPILPTEEVENEFVFDLSEDTLVKTGRCNDIFLRYVTSSSCDIDVEVWDNESEEWRRVAYAIPDTIVHACSASFTEQRHMFSAYTVEAESVLDSTLQLRIRVFGGARHPKVWTLEVNPEYWTIPLSPEAPYGSGGLAFADGHFYMITFTPLLMVYEIDDSGTIHDRFSPPMKVPYGLTHDGENLWIVGAPDTMFRVNLVGEILCAFSLPTIWHGDLAWDGETLWLSEAGGPAPRLWAFDPVASCESGQAVITDSFPRPGGKAPGLAWDGSHLLIISQRFRLYRITRGGVVVDDFGLPVSNQWGAVWDGSRLCLVSGGPLGPTGLPGNEATIACFRMR